VLGTRCWLWTGYVKPNGYGGFRWNDGKGWVMAYAHRVVWTLAGQPLGKNQQANHRCDVKRCVNLDHIYKGTQSDNLHDAAKQGRMRRDVRGAKNPNYRHGHRTRA